MARIFLQEAPFPPPSPLAPPPPLASPLAWASVCDLYRRAEVRVAASSGNTDRQPLLVASLLSLPLLVVSRNPSRAEFSARFSFGQISSALINRDIVPRPRAIVERQWPDEDVVGLLLQDLHGPPRHTADGENRDEQIGRNAVQVIDHA